MAQLGRTVVYLRLINWGWKVSWLPKNHMVKVVLRVEVTVYWADDPKAVTTLSSKDWIFVVRIVDSHSYRAWSHVTLSLCPKAERDPGVSC